MLGGISMKKEEAIERIDENLETIETNKGKIRFNSVWFTVCSGIGLVATGVGIAGCIALGLTTFPLVTTGIGVATTIVPNAIKSYERKQYNAYDEIAEEQEEIKEKLKK